MAAHSSQLSLPLADVYPTHLLDTRPVSENLKFLGLEGAPCSAIGHWSTKGTAGFPGGRNPLQREEPFALEGCASVLPRDRLARFLEGDSREDPVNLGCGEAKAPDLSLGNAVEGPSEELLGDTNTTSGDRIGPGFLEKKSVIERPLGRASRQAGLAWCCFRLCRSEVGILQIQIQI